MQAGKVIIAIDGNVYSGKTTVLTNIGEQFVKEHNYFTEVPQTKDRWAIHKCYVESEIKRAECELNRIVYLDRSIFSLAAHTYALYYVYRHDYRREFLELIAGDSYKIIWPTLLVVLSRNYCCSLFSYLHDKVCNDRKKTPFMFIRPRYFLVVNRFYKHVSEIIHIEFIRNITLSETIQTIQNLDYEKTQLNKSMILRTLSEVLCEQ